MPWTDSAEKMFAAAMAELGLRGWKQDMGEWMATILSDAKARKATVALGREPQDEKEQAEVLAHEAMHAFIESRRNQGLLSLDKLWAELERRFGKR